MREMARCGGFTYVALVVLLAVLGLVAAAGLKVGALRQRAAAEEELLEIGAAFSEALRSYAAATPVGKRQQPPNLQALLKDPRFPETRRHLRKIFVDPITGKDEWGVVTMGDNVGVVAVYSLSTSRPLKVGNFDSRFVNFENKERISDWKFTAAGQGVTLLRSGPDTPPAAANARGAAEPPPGPAEPPVAPEPAPPPAQPAPEETAPPADQPAEELEQSPEPPVEQERTEGEEQGERPPAASEQVAN